MAVWKVARLGRVSSLTGEPLPPDTEVVTALFGAWNPDALQDVALHVTAPSPSRAVSPGRAW